MAEKTSELLDTTPYTGETPQADQLNRRDYSVTPDDAEPEVWYWAADPTHVSVGRSPEEVQAQLQVNQLERPYAAGLLHLRNNWEAAWQVQRSNMALGPLMRRLRRYTGDQGWKWDSIEIGRASCR